MIRTLARRVAEESPDVVALLEVSAGDVEILASQLDLDCVHSDYTGSGSRNTGGLAVCVRTEGRWSFSKGWADRFVDDDDWYYTTAEVAREGRRVNLVAVHLLPYSFKPSWLLSGRKDGPRAAARGLFDLFEAGEQVSRGQAGQVRALLDRVSTLRDPTLVVGDFNSTRDAHLHRALRQRLQDTWERGGQGFGATVRFADRVPLRIDYIYATGDFAVSRATVGRRDCSDHAPVISEVVLRGS